MTTASQYRANAAEWFIGANKAGLATIIGLPLLLSSGPCAAADREMSREYTVCFDKSNGVTAEMINCILAETTRQDARLNENYKNLMSKLSQSRKQALLEAQRAWIQFRDANCRFYDDPEGGSIARVTANECILNATADRAKELQLSTDQ